MNAVLVVPASAPGLGGIGILLVVGEGAAEVTDRVLRPPGVCGRPLRHGWIHDATGPVEEVVCRWTPAAASPFGRETVEVNAHGSPISLARCRDALVAAGGRAASPEELPPLLAAGQGWDDLQREAFTHLLRARTRLAAAMLLDQVGGALSRALAALRERPDPDALAALRATAPTGIALVDPRRIAIVGPPNAGKSTLFNRLVGYERALVHPSPGTTRDPVEEEVSFAGVPFRLADTAGVRETDHPVERLGIAAGLRAAEEADLLLLVHDLSRSDCDPDLLDSARRARPDRPVLEVWNKADLAPGPVPPHACSALTGAGIDDLVGAIPAALHLDPSLIRPGAPILFRRVLELGWTRWAQNGTC